MSTTHRFHTNTTWRAVNVKFNEEKKLYIYYFFISSHRFAMEHQTQFYDSIRSERQNIITNLRGHMN